MGWPCWPTEAHCVPRHPRASGTPRRLANNELIAYDVLLAHKIVDDDF
jgi:hypothetical protein